MKRNLLKVIAAAVLTAALLVLAACGGYNSDYLPIKEQGGISLKNVSEINLASNEIVTEHVAAHNTVIIRNNETTPNTYCLYDLTKKAYVGEKNYTSLSASSGNYANGIFKVRKGTSSDDYVYGAINIYGTEIVAVNKKNTTDIDLLDGGKIVRVLTEYFRVKSDKSLERIADSNNINFSIASGDINNLHIFGDYLYTYSGTISSGVSSLNVYSLKGELLKKFLSESETGTKYFVLNEGNVLKMKNFRVPDDSNDFTYFTASFQKFKVIYELYNVKNNSSKSIDFKYYITYVQCGEASDKEFYSETYSKSNLVRAYEIKDKKYLQANDYLKYLFVNNSLKIEAEQELSTVYMLEENRYLHVSVNGEGSYIKDKSGNTIATIGTNFTPSVTKINSGLIVVAKAVSTTVTKYGAIDFEGNLIVDCEYDELSAFFGGGALGRNGTGSSAERYNVIVNFGIVETTKIDTYTQVGGLANFYRSDNDYFAVNGTELFTASTYNVSYLMSDGSCLFRVDDAKYYYVK